MTKFEILISEPIKINQLTYRNQKLYNNIIIWAYNFIKPLQASRYHDRVRNKWKLEHIDTDEILTIEINKEDLLTINTETFWNNWTSIYGIAYNNVLLFENHPTNIPPEGNWSFIFLSLFGLSFMAYEYIEKPWIKPKVGLILSGVVSLLLPFLICYI